MTTINLNWPDFKSFVDQRSVSIQWLDIDGNYYLYAYDGPFSAACLIPKNTPASANQTDFENNYKTAGNISPNFNVTTQFELNNKDLKLARGMATVDGTGKAIVTLKVPGAFGSGDGRYVAGGYGMTEDYEKDDYVLVYVEDTDRLLAMYAAQQADPNATEPLTDDQMRALGEFPNYPVVKSYTDDECDLANQGWYFWPASRGSSLAPIGEVEIEPIGGYGFIPSGFYLKIEYFRNNLTTGAIRVNYWWGKRG
jgi:hypothetical protein